MQHGAWRLLRSLAVVINPTCRHAHAGVNAGGRGNLFAFLNLPMDAACDGTVLQRNYHEKQSAVHPDQQHAASLPTTTASGGVLDSNTAQQLEESSAYANAAYETLRDPFRRCRYLLKYCVAEQKKRLVSPSTSLNASEEESVYFLEDSRENLGGDLAPSDPASTLDPDFLESMMEMNEFVHSYPGDDSATEEEKKQLDEIEGFIMDQDKALFAAASAAWQQRDTGRFRAVVLRWTYVNNLKHHIRQVK